MMYKNGIDIIDINRIRKVIDKYGFRFKKNVSITVRLKDLKVNIIQ